MLNKFEKVLVELLKVKILKKNEAISIHKLKKKYCVFILPSWFSKLFYNYHSHFLLSEKWKPSQKLSECLEPLSLSELWEPLCRTDGSNPGSPLLAITDLAPCRILRLPVHFLLLFLGCLTLGA